MKVLLAYSGGLDTSVILRWIRETYRAEVITYSGDVGQGSARDAVLGRGVAYVMAEEDEPTAFACAFLDDLFDSLERKMLHLE